MRFQYFLFLIIVLFYSISVFPQFVETLTDTLRGSGDLSIDENGIIYVSDWGDEPGNPNGTKVLRVYKDGTIEEFAGGLMSASGSDFDDEGNLILSNYLGRYLSRISPSGNVTNFATNFLFAPLGLAVVKDSIIYVADCGREAIVKVNNNGSLNIFATDAEFNCPTGLTYNDDGHLFVSNFSDGKIFKVLANGTVTKLATLPIENTGHIAFANNFIYAVGTCSRKIYRISMEGNFQVIAGTGDRGNDDGPALEATFNQLNGIAVSEDGDTLFVNDAVSLEGDCLDDSPLNPVKIRMIIGLNSISDIYEQSSNIPSEFDLFQNYPNPFNPSTKISWQSPVSGRQTLKVYDVLGNEVVALLNEFKPAGRYEIEFDINSSSGIDIPSGVYFYKLQVGEFRETKKMLLIK